jgi:hypothetical protein
MIDSWRRLWLLLAVVAAAIAVSAGVQAGDETVRIGWLSQTQKRTLPLTYLDQPPVDEGIQGARLGITDDNTTGHFTGQSFELVESVAPTDDVTIASRDLAAKGVRLIVTDLDAAKLLTVASMS